MNLALSLRGDGLADPAARDVVERRAKNGLKIAESHRDWPTVLAAALDELALEGWDVKAAAGRLGVSASRVVRTLKTEAPRAHTAERPPGRPRPAAAEVVPAAAVDPPIPAAA